MEISVHNVIDVKIRQRKLFNSNGSPFFVLKIDIQNHDSEYRINLFSDSEFKNYKCQ